MATFFLTAFVAVAAFGSSVLTEPEGALDGPGAGVLGVGLLVADSVLPVASSVVMVSLGALYGPLAGVALALVGRIGCFLAGFALGRRTGGRLLRAVPSAQRERAEDMLARRGGFAILVTRPLPILGDTVAILAGASRMSWRRGAVAAAVGSLPEAVAYALAGALAASSADAAVLWGGFVLVSAAFWVAAGRSPDRTLPRDGRSQLTRAGTAPRDSRRRARRSASRQRYRALVRRRSHRRRASP